MAHQQRRMTARAGLVLVSALCAQAAGPIGPGGGGGAAASPGYATASSCGSATTCSDTSTSYVSRSLTYSPTTGKLTGTITMNQCPGVVTTFTRASATCVQLGATDFYENITKL